MDRFGGWVFQRGESLGRRRRSPRVLLTLALLVSALTLAAQSSPISAAPGLMPADWIVTCDTATNTVSITPVSNNIYTSGQPVAINLFQSSSSSQYFDVWGATTTISSGVAAVTLESLIGNLNFLPSIGFTTNEKVWSVLLDDFSGNPQYRLGAITTAFVNGVRECRPQASDPNPDMPVGWEVECNVSSNSIRISSTDPNSQIPTTGSISLVKLDSVNSTDPTRPPTLVLSAPLVFIADPSSPGGGVASASLSSLGGGVFPADPTNWVVVLSSNGRNFKRVDATTTAIENSLRVCPPPVLKVNVVNQATGQVQRGARVFAVPVQLCNVIEGEIDQLTSGVLGSHVLARGQAPAGLYWIGVAAPAGLASQWFDQKPCELATQILVKPDGTVEPPPGAIVSSDPNVAPVITARLKVGRVARLTVEGPSGEPVIGACVTAFTWKPDELFGIFVGNDCESTDGVYEVPGIVIGLPITLQIEPPVGLLAQFLDARLFSDTTGFTIAENGDFIAEGTGSSIPREVTLSAAGGISGVVKGPLGADGAIVPAAGVCIVAVEAVSGNFSRPICTGDSGEFYIGVDPNRAYRVRFDGTRAGLGVTFYGGATFGSADLVQVGTDTTPLGEVVLVRAASIPIEVRDTAGQPVTRACAEAWGDTGSGTFSQFTNTTCYAFNGNYLLGGLEAGKSYKINIYAPGLRSTWFDGSLNRDGATPVEAPGTDPIQVQLEPGSGFRVKVTDSVGNPVGACLSAYKPTEEPIQWGEPLISRCEPSGNLNLSSLEPGTSVTLRVNTFGGSSASSWLGTNSGGSLLPVALENRAIFEVGANIADLGEVRLVSALGVTGNVTLDDAPVAGVCAEAISVRSDGSPGSFLAGGCSNSAGRFGISGIPSDTSFRVRFSNPSLDVVPAWFKADTPNGVSDPTLATLIDSSRTDVNINLTRGSSLQVNVVGETSPGGVSASGVVTGVCVGTIDADGRRSSGACTDESGRALIRSLPAGTYTLWLQSSNPLYRSGLATSDDGTTVMVSVPGTSSVTVTARTGRVVSGVVKLGEVAIPDACVVATASGVTGSDGAADPVSCSDENGNYLLVLDPDPDLTYSFSVVDSQDPPRFSSQDLGVFTGGDIQLSSPSPASEGISAFVGATETEVNQTDSLFVSSTTSDSVSLRWETETEGPYTVTAKIGNSLVFETATDNKQLTILGLVQGPTYRIEVLSGGNSLATVNVRANAEQEGPPLPPGKPSVDRVDDNSISISWSPVSSSGSPIQYIAYLFDASNNNLVAEVSTSAPAAVFAGVGGPARYVARVSATNNNGASSLSDVSDFATISDGLAPGQPRQLATSPIPGGLQIDWLAPSDTGGAATLWYEVEVSQVVTSSPSQASTPLTCNTTSTTCPLTGLVPNTTYNVSVTAFSNSGSSSPLMTEVLFVGLSKPSNPGNVSAVGGDGRAVVSWEEPEFNGESPILEYIVTAEPGGRTCTTSTTLSCTVSRLTNGTSYTFSVVARNAIGSSDPGESGTILIAVPPSAPTRLSAKALSGTSVRVSWMPPRSDGGFPITGYEIRYSTSGVRPVGVWTPVEDPLSLDYTIEDLIPGKQVIIEVRAINATFDGALGTTRVRTPFRG